MALNLDEDQVTRLNTLLRDAKDRGEELCRSMQSDYANVVGGNWKGIASMAALGKSDEMLQFWNSQLAPILDKLTTGIVGTQNLMSDHESDSQSKINAVTPGMGGNFATRMA
ncbi:hypothetical protein HNR02_006795 [Amycolatopsis endophytica]|uniref:WXG100 family type VII secretion target n=1 Tax=Amycolatopsis endophytica TaxID=860233 RepID=A0A853BEG6_9PSEU|nr:hypothetical protein [Amycolatopsis endophytica]NYI93420.1 hypothetical protein [Amycolatopsis endophytica]